MKFTGAGHVVKMGGEVTGEEESIGWYARRKEKCRKTNIKSICIAGGRRVLRRI